MARIFSISFPFADADQHALVSVQKTPFFTEYHISLHDDTLRKFLPSNKILSSSPGHYVFLHIAKENYTLLMQELIKAIAYHVNISQVTSE